MKERHNNTFFGSGETVLFSLKPDSKCYRWTAESDLILRANDDELIVGSGGGYVMTAVEYHSNHLRTFSKQQQQQQQQ